MAAGDDHTCPTCERPLPAESDECPRCVSGSPDESAVDLPERDGLLDEDERAELLDAAGKAAGGRPTASRGARLLAGLAVSIPLAPLVFFLVGAVVPLSAWSAVTVFVAGWLGPAVYLVRARVPAEAFGRSLFLLGGGTALVPVALRFGDATPPAVRARLGGIAAVCLVVAGACLALGTFVTNQVRPDGGVGARVSERRDERQ